MKHLFLKGEENLAKTPEVRKKISEALKGRVFTKEWREKISIAKKGKKLSKKHKEKVSMALKGKKKKPFTEEHKLNIKKARAKQIFTEETRAKFRAKTGENALNWRGGISKDLAHYNRRYRNLKLNAEGSHTKQEWEDLKKECDYMCLCCKRYEPEIVLHQDHIIPLTKGGNDYISNIQPLCRSCNSRKNNKTINYKNES